MNIRPHPVLVAAALLVAAAFTSTPLAAQEATNAVAKPTASDTPERPPYRPWTVGVGIGTDTIFGGGVSWRFSDHLGVRVGAGYAEDTREAVGIAGIKYNARLQLLAEPLTLDVYPWQKHSFHVSLGVLFNQNELTGTASDTGTIIIDGHPFPSDQVGSLQMRVKQQPVDPYLSIGGNLLYFDHAHHWALAGELGVAYTGDPRISLDRSGPASLPIDDALRHAKDRLQNYANQYTWWPIVKLAVTFSF